MIDPTKTTPEKLAEMNDSLIIDNNYLRAEVAKLKTSLNWALKEAEGWLDEARGAAFADVLGSESQYETARSLLK